MPQYDALLKAAAFNANLIFKLMDEFDTITKQQIVRKCQQDGYADDISIDIAIRRIINDGYMVKMKNGSFRKSY